MNTYQRIIKYAPSCIFALLMVYIGLFAYRVAQPVHAAPGLQFVSTNSQIATSSKDYGNPFATSTFLAMTPGTGTTTLTMNTNNVDQVGLNIEFKASSTSSILNWRYEYSSNASDWYSADVPLSTNATTTTAVRTFAEYTWAFASSTGGTSNSNTSFKHVDITGLGTPYFRVVFYVPNGAGNASVNAQAVLKSSNPI